MVRVMNLRDLSIIVQDLSKLDALEAGEMRSIHDGLRLNRGWWSRAVEFCSGEPKVTQLLTAYFSKLFQLLL